MQIAIAPKADAAEIHRPHAADQPAERILGHQPRRQAAPGGFQLLLMEGLMHRHPGDRLGHVEAGDPLGGLARSQRVDGHHLVPHPDDQQVAIRADVIDRGIVEAAAVPVAAAAIQIELGSESLVPLPIGPDDRLLRLLRIERDVHVGQKRSHGAI